MKVYFKRNGNILEGATNIKSFNDLNTLNGIHYLHLEHVLRTLSLQNVISVMRGIYERLAPGGKVYISELDLQLLAGKIKYEQTTLEDFNTLCFQQGNVSILSLYWLKTIMEQIGFKIHSCSLTDKEFWIESIK